jgi:DNA repair exonuclease SbcCD ATPase subunit
VKTTVITFITSIYILGFNLEGIDSACLKVERNYVDLIDKKILTQKSYFIENLTHDSYIVQVKRITDRYQTSLDKLLSVFEQNNFLNDDKIIKEYSHIPDVEEVRMITEILHYSGTSPDERREIEIEIEAWRTFNASQSDATKKAIRDLEKTRKELEEEKKEKEKMKEEKEKMKEEKEKMKEEKEKIREEKEKMREEKDQIIAETQKRVEQQQKQMQEMQKMMEELKRRLDNSDNQN